MSCPFCKKNFNNIKERIFFDAEGWVAFLDSNPILSGHTILARKLICDPVLDSITVKNLAGFDQILPKVVETLKEAYKVNDVLVTSLRGTIKHMHFHLIPLTVSAQRTWRKETLWEKGHLHELLGYYEKKSYIENRQERVENSWTEGDQRIEHTKKLMPEVVKLRRVIARTSAMSAKP